MIIYHNFNNHHNEYRNVFGQNQTYAEQNRLFFKHRTYRALEVLNLMKKNRGGVWNITE